MPPPPIQRDLRGRPLDAKGRPLDAHGRPLDGMDRPLVNRVIEPVTRLAVPGYPKIAIAFPSLGDWTAIYDPRNNRGAALNQTTFFEFRDRHERTMQKLLAEIAASRCGAALLAQSNASASFNISILPMDFVSSRDMWVKYHNNAISTSDGIDSRVIGMYAGTAADGSNLTGSGFGSSAEIFFSPERLKRTGPGMKPDEVLFHEIVHAVRALQGVMTLSFKMGRDYDNDEEFAAVVVTNVYLSEKKQTALRANHASGVLRNPDKFLDSPDVPAPGARMLLSGFRLRQPTFFEALAKIDRPTAAFNPFRQLDEETRRATAAHDAKMRQFDRQR
jgi:hypothetical protein